MNLCRLAAITLLLGPLVLVAEADDPCQDVQVADDRVAKLVYRGFTVDISILDEVEHAGKTLGSLKHQIDAVLTTRVQPEIAQFFTIVPIKLSTEAGASLGKYEAGAVLMTTDPIDPARNVLVHELLHAYHDQKMSRELRRRVGAYYQEAPQAYKLPRTEYAMSNEQEYFAVTASIYLRGSSSRKPHDRATIRAAQPEYYKFLGEMFDPVPVEAKKPSGR